MAKKPKLVKVRIDIPDEKWAKLVELTGETDPSRVADVALREFVRHYSKGKQPND
jgi:hypothetical protein